MPALREVACYRGASAIAVEAATYRRRDELVPKDTELYRREVICRGLERLEFSYIWNKYFQRRI
jgi:hypothetical protein